MPTSSVVHKPRIPHSPVKPGEVRSLTLQQLGNFDFDPNKDTTIPPDVQALDGARVRLRGAMIPYTQSDQITEFALVPALVNYWQYSGPQFVVCRTPKDKPVAYIMDDILVEGTLRINILREDNYTYRIFELDVNDVRPAK